MSQQRFAYQVLEVRDSLFRGKQSGSELARVINEQAAVGWKLHQIISDDIKGRMGVGSTSGVLLVFEYEYRPEDLTPAVADADGVAS